MSDDASRGTPGCDARACDREAELWVYSGGRAWTPLCERHVLELHPSLEVGAWLESGYAVPAELGAPGAEPDEPRSPREAEFRRLVEEAVGGWEGD